MSRNELCLDLLSGLPKDTLVQIVSCLPLKEAIRTSILSTSWRELWTSNLVSFDALSLHHMTSNEALRVIQTVGKFLQSYYSHEIWKLRLQCADYEQSSNMKEKLQISCVKGVHKELLLQFHVEEQETAPFTWKLDMAYRGIFNHSLYPSSFASLKSLFLKSVPHLAEQLIPALFASCEALECLSIEKCFELQCLDITATSSLKSLIVKDCPNMVDITLSAHNLQYFTYQGALLKIEFKNNVPNLGHVSLDFRDVLILNEFDCEELLSLFSSLKDVEDLTLSGWLLEWLYFAGVIFRHLDFRFNRLKHLCWIEHSINKPRRDSLTCFIDICPSLESLTIRVDGRRNSNSVARPYFHQYWHEPYFWRDYEVEKSTHLQMQNLRIVKLIGFENQMDELLMLDILLKRALLINLMMVTFAADENRTWEVKKLPLSQLKQLATKKITILSPKKDYYFLFT